MPEISFRPVEMNDAMLLLAWRNDPATRAASHHSAEVSQDAHMAWLRASLADPSRRLLIAEWEGSVVGTVRADLENECWLLSWTVAPEHRKMGIGTRMVAALVRQLGPVEVRAEVRRGNVASSRIAQGAGLVLVREEGEVLHYRRPAK